MSKKKINLNFSYDSPVALTFVIITVLIYVLNTFVLKNKFETFFISPTNAEGLYKFDFTKPVSYFQLVLYQFGYSNISLLFADCIIILLLGQILEEKYGSVIVGLMMFFSTLFAGVLNACFCKESISGASSIVIMMVFLNALTYISKSKISLLSIAAIALAVCREIFAGEQGLLALVVTLAGGLCGSLFAFLASPKARGSSKKSSKKSRDELLEELDSQSPRYKNKNAGSDDETVVIGTLEL